MSGSQEQGGLSGSDRRGPTVRIDSPESTRAGETAYWPVQRARRASGLSVRAMIVMPLLFASTSLAVYDLYLLSGSLGG